MLVANVVSGLLGSMSAKVLSVTKYDSTEFFSLTKTVYSVGGAKQEKWSLKIPEDLLNTTFVISDAIAEGDGSQFIAGMPGLAYSGIPLYFALDKDRTMIHVYEKQLKSRATNAEDHILLEHGATDTWLTSGPIASDDRATGTITVDITQLLKMNFLIPFQTWTKRVATFAKGMTPPFPRSVMSTIRSCTHKGDVDLTINKARNLAVVQWQVFGKQDPSRAVVVQTRPWHFE